VKLGPCTSRSGRRGTRIARRAIGGWAVTQVWLFWLAPIAGGVVGAVIYRWIAAEKGVQSAAGVADADADELAVEPH
jgi:aquaporin Z